MGAGSRNEVDIKSLFWNPAAYKSAARASKTSPNWPELFCHHQNHKIPTARETGLHTMRTTHGQIRAEQRFPPAEPQAHAQIQEE